MSLLVSDAQTALAYRLGEDSAPTNSAELARRRKFIDQANKALFKRHRFWWSQADASFSTVADQEFYTPGSGGYPADVRDIVEIRVNGVVYTYIPPHEVFGVYEYPVSIYNLPNVNGEHHWYIWNKKLYLLPVPSEILTVKLKYWRKPATLTSDSDELYVPEEYGSALDAFAYGRIMQIDDERGSAADGFDEFEEAVRDMKLEQNQLDFYNKSVKPTHPDILVE